MIKPVSLQLVLLLLLLLMLVITSALALSSQSESPSLSVTEPAVKRPDFKSGETSVVAADDDDDNDEDEARSIDSCRVSDACEEGPGSSCPVWFVCANGKCRCKKSFRDAILCEQEKQKAMVLDCFCVTYNEETNQTEAGACFANCGKPGGKKDNPAYTDLGRDKHMVTEHICGHLSRAGTLCGKCNDTTCPLVHSYTKKCIECWPKGEEYKSWLLYIAAAYVPLTFFYFFVLFFKVNVTSSHLHGFVLFSQCISISASSRLLLSSTTHSHIYTQISKVLVTIYGIWNLDFFRAYTTIPLNVESLTVIALDYVVAVYPLVLTVLSLCLIKLYDRNVRLIVLMWKPFRYVLMLLRRNWDSRTSVVDAYSTFFLLSYMKLLDTSFSLMFYTTVHTLETSDKKTRLYYDATKEFWGRAHRPYAVISILVMTVVVFIPMLVLFLYQSSVFQKFLSTLPIRMDILHTFVDAFQGCYRDGTEPGTRDCRWFSGMYLLFRVILIFIIAVSPTATFFAFSTIIILFFVILLIGLQPYKNSLFQLTMANAAFLIFTSLVHTSIAGYNIAQIKDRKRANLCATLGFFFSILPAIYLCVYTVHWCMTRRKFGLEFLNKVHPLRRGYQWISNRNHSTVGGSGGGGGGAVGGEPLPHRMEDPDHYHKRNMTRFDSAKCEDITNSTVRTKKNIDQHK